MQDKNHSSSKRGVPEHDRHDAAVPEIQKERPDSSSAVRDVHKFTKHEAPGPQNAPAEVNMEVPVNADEVMRAGGFGASDDISSVIPVASDFTDFEDHLREIRGYEKSEDKVAEGQSDPPKVILETGEDDTKDIDNVEKHVAPEARHASGAVNMEASVTADEVVRAGGFGATDNISSYLPVASDFTDFEANIREAREYEDLEEEADRPGLGWTSETK